MFNFLMKFENKPVTQLEEQIVKSNGDLASKTYEVGRVLGQGTFATVYELKTTDSVLAGKLTAKKLVTKKAVFLKLVSEVKIHRSLQHPHIVQFEHFFETPQYFVLTTELCPNMTLRDLLQRRIRLDEDEAKCLVYQLLQAVSYLHSKNVVHRDIKPSNIYLDASMNVKLGDFGLATQLSFASERRRTRCGTPICTAPEALDRTRGHSREVDVWAVGVLAYMLVCGQSPFAADSISRVYQKVQKISYSFTAEHSRPLRDLIRTVFVKNPAERPTASELLTHEWFAMKSFPARLPLASLAIPPKPETLKSLPWVTVTQSSSPTCYSERKVKQWPRGTSAFRRLKDFVFVQKWLDCSKEYGLAYVLSNGQIGMHFNDSTKVVTIGSTNSFRFYSQADRTGTVESTTAYSKTEQKKVVLLQHFAKSLCKDRRETGSGSSVFVEVWIARPEFVLFRLNTKLIQAKFYDDTEFIIEPDNYKVTFIDKSGNQHRCSLSDTSKSPKLARRMQFIKEVFKSQKKLLNHPD